MTIFSKSDIIIKILFFNKYFMASEFSPAASRPRMTQAQIRKYMKEMEKKRKIAKEKLEEFEKSGELEKEIKELKDLEKELENL